MRLACGGDAITAALELVKITRRGEVEDNDDESPVEIKEEVKKEEEVKEEDGESVERRRERGRMKGGEGG